MYVDWPIDCMIRYTFCAQHMDSAFLYTNMCKIFATAPAAGTVMVTGSPHLTLLLIVMRFACIC
jgi:hypothetical protein